MFEELTWRLESIFGETIMRIISVEVALAVAVVWTNSLRKPPVVRCS